MQFTRATKEQSKLRLALCGTAGTGKTFSSLAIASELVPGGRIALIDTERGSASLYADRFTFDTLSLETHSPELYIEAIQAAERMGYDVIIVDSLSHAWAGRDGSLERVDKIAKRSQSGNTFTAWRDVTPVHNRLIDAIISVRAHMIATMRSKTEWILEENDKGKKTPKRVGMEPVMRSGVEYEFGVVGDLNLEHQLVITKTRCSELTNAVIDRPGAQIARTLRAWLSAGVAPTTPKPVTSPVTEAEMADHAARSAAARATEAEYNEPASRVRPGPDEPSGVMSELDRVFAEYLGAIAEAPDLVELDRVATGSAKPERGTEQHRLATAAYVQRKEWLLAQAKEASKAS